MGRLFVYLAIAATAVGVIMLMPESDPRQASESMRGLLSTLLPLGGAWLVGLSMGLGLSWLARYDWHRIPEAIMLWARVMRHRLWWMICGGVFASFLLFF